MGPPPLSLPRPLRLPSRHPSLPDAVTQTRLFLWCHPPSPTRMRGPQGKVGLCSLHHPPLLPPHGMQGLWRKGGGGGQPAPPGTTPARLHCVVVWGPVNAEIGLQEPPPPTPALAVGPAWLCAPGWCPEQGPLLTNSGTEHILAEGAEGTGGPQGFLRSRDGAGRGVSSQPHSFKSPLCPAKGPGGRPGRAAAPAAVPGSRPHCSRPFSVRTLSGSLVVLHQRQWLSGLHCSLSHLVLPPRPRTPLARPWLPARGYVVAFCGLR